MPVDGMVTQGLLFQFSQKYSGVELKGLREHASFNEFNQCLTRQNTFNSLANLDQVSREYSMKNSCYFPGEWPIYEKQIVSYTL